MIQRFENVQYLLILKVNNAAFRFAERVKEYENLEECIRPLDFMNHIPENEI